MNFETALKNELKTISALQNRVYPLLAPEAKSGNGVPYLIYSASDGLPTKTMGGYGSNKAINGEINVVAERYEDMKSLTNAVTTLLASMMQRVIGGAGPYIQELTYQEPVELYEEAPKLFRCLIDYEVYF